MPGRSKDNLNKVIINSLQGIIKRSDEGFRFSSNKILIFIWEKKIVLYGG